MVEPPEAAAVADELRLLDFIDQNPPQKPRERIEAAALGDPSSLLLDDLLGPSAGSVPGSPPGKSSDGLGELNEEEEEELEWLSNKDAFPPLETSFEVAGASPVSVLPKSFKVPVRARSNIRRKKRRVFAPVRLAAPPPRAKEGRRCRHCEAEATPQWRVGPEGPKTLCNACGVRFKKGRLFPEYRPANSPTFSAAVHSNSTRGIMEMRMGLRRPGSRGRRRRPMAIS